jgi:hypothetical protein
MGHVAQFVVTIGPSGHEAIYVDARERICPRNTRSLLVTVPMTKRDNPRPQRSIHYYLNGYTAMVMRNIGKIALSKPASIGVFED